MRILQEEWYVPLLPLPCLRPARAGLRAGRPQGERGKAFSSPSCSFLGSVLLFIERVEKI